MEHFRLLFAIALLGMGKNFRVLEHNQARRPVKSRFFCMMSMARQLHLDQG
jgi:hypothetical protein